MGRLAPAFRSPHTFPMDNDNAIRQGTSTGVDSESILSVGDLEAADVTPVEGENVKGGLLPPGFLQMVPVISTGGVGSSNTSTAGSVVSGTGHL
jgi:hypothetical protein